MKTLFFSIVFVCLFWSGKAQDNNDRIIISDEVELIKVSDKAYIHVSSFYFPSYGKVYSNGVVLVDGGEAYLFDTPVTNEQTATLVDWVNTNLQTKIIGFVPNHGHDDCIGGLEYLHTAGVTSYAGKETVQFTIEKGLLQPQHAFKDSIYLKVGETDIHCYYLGGGHATDNIVVWIPSEKLLYPGCMVKDLETTGLGNLSDADVESWPETIEKVIRKFPSAKWIVPGHGPAGGQELLFHTLDLLKK